MRSLAGSIDTVLGATRDLRTKLEAGDLAGCADLLEMREKALAEFREIYDGSSTEERTRNQELLAVMVRDDEEIRNLADAQRLEAAGDLARSPHVNYDSNEPVNACLDRRA